MNTGPRPAAARFGQADGGFSEQVEVAGPLVELVPVVGDVQDPLQDPGRRGSDLQELLRAVVEVARGRDERGGCGVPPVRPRDVDHAPPLAGYMRRRELEGS